MELKDRRNGVEAGEKSVPPPFPAVNFFPHSPPPASFSSPTHDFEFTISFCPSGSDNLRKLPSSSFNVDFSPADDLFYQGHLLPLHHQLFASTPRTSSGSCTSNPWEAGQQQQYNHQSYNHVLVQADEYRDKQRQICNTVVSRPPATSAGDPDEANRSSETHINSTRIKPKSFSLVALKKGSKLGLKSAKELIERYIKMVKPLFVRKIKEAEDDTRRRGNLNRQRRSSHPSSSHSFSNQRYSRSSAPCSLMTSPGNSGILCAIPSSNESTMEELQNGIQAAIAHCKNSIAVKEEGKSAS